MGRSVGPLPPSLPAYRLVTGISARSRGEQSQDDRAKSSRPWRTSLLLGSEESRFHPYVGTGSLPSRRDLVASRRLVRDLGVSRCRCAPDLAQDFGFPP